MAGRLLPSFTGIDSAYKPDETPELRVGTAAQDVPAAADAVLALPQQRGVLRGQTAGRSG